MAKVRYEDALRLLQSNQPIVQLTISQIATTPIDQRSKKAGKPKVDLYKSEENFRSLELYSILSHNENEPNGPDEEGVFEDPVLRYFSNMRQEQEERAAERRQLEISANGGSLPRVLTTANKSLSLSKSVPDLPKVVAIIPKRVDRPPALPKCIGLGRRYTGPVRYPVTPAKDPLSRSSTSLEGLQNKRQLTLLPADEHRESQVI